MLFLSVGRLIPEGSYVSAMHWGHKFVTTSNWSVCKATVSIQLVLLSITNDCCTVYVGAQAGREHSLVPFAILHLLQVMT